MLPKRTMAASSCILRPLSCRRILSSLKGVSMIQALSCQKHLHYSSPLQNSEEQKLQNTYDPDEILEYADFFDVKQMVKLSDLFKARVHLGHHEGCWNPHMKQYIYGTRAHHHIIDLNKTVKHFQVALNVLSHIVYRNGIVLFLNTHPRFEYLYQKTAREAGEYCITQKWRGGTFTNVSKMLGDIRLPDVIITSSINSFGENLLPLKEAAMCNIPTIGIVDTDCDPRLITYSIPGNDDTLDSMELYCDLLKETILNAKKVRNGNV